MSLSRRMLCTRLLRCERLLVVMSGRKVEILFVGRNKGTLRHREFPKSFSLNCASPRTIKHTGQWLVQTLWPCPFSTEHGLGNKTHHKTLMEMLILACRVY